MAVGYCLYGVGLIAGGLAEIFRQVAIGVLHLADATLGTAHTFLEQLYISKDNPKK